MTSSSRRFRFVQFEFPWALGPEPGRYSIREQLGEGVGFVLVLSTLGAPQRRLLARRSRARDAPPQPPASPVVTSRATLIDTAALPDVEAAERWLCDADLGALADDALARCNRVLHAHRVATADPSAREVAIGQALVTRIGYGDAERVADGRWDRASELPAHGGRADGGRLAALRPQERLAALLSGRDPLLACEDLTLRARADADAERWREAALQLSVALAIALCELEPWREQAGLAERLAELDRCSAEARAVAQAALEGGLEATQIAAIRQTLGRLEAALRARTARGLA